MNRMRAQRLVFFAAGALFATGASELMERIIRGPEEVIVTTSQLRLSTSASGECSGQAQVTVEQGTTLRVRRHGAVTWLEFSASIVGKNLPFIDSGLASSAVLTCGRW